MKYPCFLPYAVILVNGLMFFEGRGVKQMFRIAICDDERIFAEELKMLISACLSERRIAFGIDIFKSGKEFVAIGEGIARYTAVFLDINMDGVNGIEAAKKIRSVSREVFIVFVTAHISYSLEGYRLDAVRYLLKGGSGFPAAVQECLDAIIRKLNSVVEKVFNFREGRKTVGLENLLYVESRLHKLEFHVMEGTVNIYTMYGKLDEVEDMLGEGSFIRIQKSFLVNLKYIRNVTGYQVVMTDGLEITVSRAKYTDVKDKFTHYQGEF